MHKRSSHPVKREPETCIRESHFSLKSILLESISITPESTSLSTQGLFNLWWSDPYFVLSPSCYTKAGSDFSCRSGIKVGIKKTMKLIKMYSLTGATYCCRFPARYSFVSFPGAKKTSNEDFSKITCHNEWNPQRNEWIKSKTAVGLPYSPARNADKNAPQQYVRSSNILSPDVICHAP